MDPNFRSSDVESDGEPRMNPYSHRGAASIEKLLSKDPMETRLSSKKVVQGLNLLDGASNPNKAGELALWKNRWTAFERSILGRSAPQLPTADDIVRFLSQVPDIVQTRGEKHHDVASLKVMNTAFRSLTENFTFEFPNFRWSTTDRLKIRVLLSTMRNEGKVTKHKKRDVQWLGILVVKAMARGILGEALSQGTYSWDVAIYKAFSLVFVTSLGSRVGDVGLSSGYGSQTPGQGFDYYMRYEHIRIVMFDSHDGSKTLGMHVDIAYQKGHKQDDHNQLVTISALPDPTDSVICPVRLLLTHALRAGVCQATTFSDVVRLIECSPRKTLSWLHPKWPVLCALSGSATGYLPEQTAGKAQLITTFRYAADLIGILPTIITHDSRRGFFRDNAHLPKEVEIHGVATLAVATAGGHSQKALSLGVTHEYVGGISTDIHSKRVAQPARRNDARAIPHDEHRPYKKPKLSTEAIDSQCEATGLMKDNDSDRKKARRKLLDVDRLKWSKGDTASDDAAKETILQPRPFSMENIKAQKAPVPALTNSGAAQSSSASAKPDLKSSSSMNLPSLPTGNDFDDIPIDPVLIGTAGRDDGFVDKLQDMICEPDHPDSLQLIVQIETMEVTQPTPKLELSVDEFVNFFSKMNLTTAWLMNHPPSHRGNSQDVPTPFYAESLPCPNRQFGCPHEGPRERLPQHSNNCKYISMEAGEALLKAKANLLVCTYPGCSARRTSKYAFTKHVKTHAEGYTPSWTPKKCEQCPDGEVYNTAPNLLKHRQKVHGEFSPRSCPIGGCKFSRAEKLFENEPALIGHLRTIHKLNKKAQEPYLSTSVGQTLKD